MLDRRAKIQNTVNTTSCRGCGGRGTHIRGWWECNVVFHSVVSYKAKHILPIGPSRVEGKNLHLGFYSSFVQTAQMCREPRCLLLDEFINCLQILKYYSALKRNKLKTMRKDGGNLNVHSWVKDAALKRLHSV